MESESPCTDKSTITEEQLDLISGGECRFYNTLIELEDGRKFTVPEPGHSVQLSSLTIEGAEGVSDVLIVTTEAGEVAVLNGDDLSGPPEAQNALAKLAVEIEGSESDRFSAQPSQSFASAQSAARCNTAPYTTLGFAWNGSFGWKYNAANQPGANALTTLKTAATTWTGYTSACGALVANNAKNNYVGTTNSNTQVSYDVACTNYDNQSTIGWGSMTTKGGVLAATCTWRLLKFTGIPLDSDQKYNTNYSWSIASNCSAGKFDFQGVATHEFGHTFGLGHSAQSANQVMKPSTGTCDTTQRSLAPGDAYGIKAIYG